MSRILPVTVMVSMSCIAFAEEPTVLPTVTVSATADNAELEAAKENAASVADLLKNDGVDFSSAGGMSALPSLNGLADDRIRIRVDGREVTSACANHMNPPLSYVDPQRVGNIQVLSGVTPVSMGGDSIAGTIIVNTAEPVFAQTAGELRKEGSLSLSASSIDQGYTSAVSAAIASDTLSLGYDASWRQANSYYNGDGGKVLDTLYKARNQSLTFAAQGDGSKFIWRVGEQRIPYQGFPNQYMDMVDNHGVFSDMAYNNSFAWGKLNTRVYWQDTKHEMGFFTDEKTGTMPMFTHGVDLGYAVSADMPLSTIHLLTVGNEYHRQRLDDWWPPVAGSMMMGPDTFWNINDGKRDRFALYAEMKSEWNSRWMSNLGIRGEIVRMNTGEVQPYNPTVTAMNVDPTYAAAFNASDRARTDNNLDLTALTRFTPKPTASYEFGIARKTRSPNLYERYAWGRNTMDMRMIGWFGDGNGYVGDPDLKPEVANTVSFAANWHSPDAKWGVRVAPHFSYVQDFIDVDTIGSFHPYNIASVTRALLQFANHDARLWGIDVSGNYMAWDNSQYGLGQIKARVAWTRGERTDGGDLYHIMPLNASISLEQMVAPWTNMLELQLIDSKTIVDEQRYEPETKGYALVNVSTRYQFTDKASLTLGIRNMLNKQYDLPLGGVSLAELKSSMTGPLLPLQGPGRSFEAALNIKF
ncbi:MAG: TonB-dependent receptor plug domain-containing protein [Gammaproteobacteria bacterium]|nr:TonB-dependent receptor plug domain-containing protein [Gammaproteobacteria bacterium]